MDVAVSYVRDGAPDPSKPLLLLDCTSELRAALSLNGYPDNELKVDCPSLTAGSALASGRINGGPMPTADWPIEQLQWWNLHDEYELETSRS